MIYEYIDTEVTVVNTFYFDDQGYYFIQVSSNTIAEDTATISNSIEFTNIIEINYSNGNFIYINSPIFEVGDKIYLQRDIFDIINNFEYNATSRWQLLAAVNNVFGNFIIYPKNYEECIFHWNTVKDLTDSEWDTDIIETSFDENIANVYEDVIGAKAMIEDGYNGSGISIVIVDYFEATKWYALTFGNRSGAIYIDSDSIVNSVEGTSAAANACFLRSYTDGLQIDGDGKYTWAHGDITMMDAGGVRNVDIYDDLEHHNSIDTFKVNGILPRAQVTFRGTAPGAQLIPFGTFNKPFSVSKIVVNDFRHESWLHMSDISSLDFDRSLAHIISASTGSFNYYHDKTYDDILEEAEYYIQPAYDSNALIVTAVGNSPLNASTSAYKQDSYIVALAYGADSENTLRHILKTRSIGALRTSYIPGDNGLPTSAVDILGQYPGDSEQWFADIALGADHEFTSKNRIGPDGSSFSCPKIAGCAALLFSKYINISAALVAMALKNGAYKSNDVTWQGWLDGFTFDDFFAPDILVYSGNFLSSFFGNGLVDVEGADQWIQDNCEFSDDCGYWVFKETSEWYDRLTHEGYFIPAG